MIDKETFINNFIVQFMIAYQMQDFKLNADYGYHDRNSDFSTAADEAVYLAPFAYQAYSQKMKEVNGN